MVGGSAFFYFPRPPDDHWLADTSLVKISFVASQRTVAVEIVGIGTSFEVRSIVGTEEDDGIFIEAKLFQFGKQFANLFVEQGDHGCKGCVCFGL